MNMYVDVNYLYAPVWLMLKLDIGNLDDSASKLLHRGGWVEVRNLMNRYVDVHWLYAPIWLTFNFSSGLFVRTCLSDVQVQFRTSIFTTT